MNRRKSVSNEDSQIFRDAIGDIKRLNDECRYGSERPLRPIACRRQLDASTVSGEWPDDPGASAIPATGEHLRYRASGVQINILKKLRRGGFAIQGELDLHGFSVEQARAQVSHFFRYALDGELRCVRIIHGKGRKQMGCAPVLKPMLNYWLQHKREVMAFCSARPGDGGTGAVYVLLRRAH